MLVAPAPKDPAVLSYLALRKAVGGIAIALPFAVTLPWLFLGHPLITSISGSYYTGMRNLFVGSLCAIAMFMLGCRGYDRKDEVAGSLAAFCALGVAFLPTSPDQPLKWVHHDFSTEHYIFASVLFATLAYFCLVLFRMTAAGVTVTRRKKLRNLVYMVCGCIILVSMASIFVLVKLMHHALLFGKVTPMLFFETSSLLAFGTAWLVKGATFLKDEQPQPPAPALH